ncbi:MAG: DNA topoisomerase, partial [Victivallaceae bacterium]
MANKLVIVESPAKARSIGKMLGDDYVILASMGHIRDLPEKSFGVDIAHDFQPVYTDTPRSKKVVKELTGAAKKASEIYLASDPDREGEAISWHLHEVLSKNFKGEFHRVTFHEITRNAIGKAFENAGSINMDLVDAQQARRVLDRIVGYMVSPLLWSHVERGISAGRVQSVALRLVVEREREILNFQPEEYWNFMARFSVNEGRAFESRLFKINGENFTIGDAETANQTKMAILSGSPFLVNNINSQDKRRHAQPPFTTSTMQQAANNLLRMSATETMRLAQELYEGVEVKGAP